MSVLRNDQDTRDTLWQNIFQKWQNLFYELFLYLLHQDPRLQRALVKGPPEAQLIFTLNRHN